jgi:gamma-glutamylcyclotransferase (GGCT)/AIG2-like uncharacterized protein YtfP
MTLLFVYGTMKQGHPNNYVREMMMLSCLVIGRSKSR